MRNCTAFPPTTPLAASALPLDEIALSIAGLSGPRFTENEELAYYLSLLRLVALVRGGAGTGNPAGVWLAAEHY